MLDGLQRTAGYFLQPMRLLRSYHRADLGADVVAGLTVAVVLIPQAIAYALIAELPAQTGLYTAILAAIVGALWGSSRHLHTGPTNAASLLVLSILLPIAAVGSPSYVAAAGLMAVMVGIFRLLMGLFGLGMLVNFVSDSVIVGFTAGAGVLIAAGQLRNLLGLAIPSNPELVATLQAVAVNLPQTHLPTLALGLATLALILLVRRVRPRWPSPLLAMIAAGAAVAVLGLDQQGVSVIGQIPRSLPPFHLPPLLDIELIGQLSTGALAVSVIGLIEAMSIARSIASQTGQRLNSNQEFVGQGLANIACGLFSGFTCSGSFTRSAVNFEAGARSGVASVFSGLFVLVATLLLAPLAAYVPRTALAAVLLITAYNMVDRREMARIWRGARGDSMIMVVTILATLLLPLQFAVLIGVLMSLAYYIWRTSLPRVYSVVPDENFRHMTRQEDPATGKVRPACPQLGIVEIVGDLYFGATHNVEETLLAHQKRHPGQHYLMLRMQSVTQIDISGIHMLESTVKAYRERGGDVYIMRVQDTVLDFMRSTGFYDLLGADHFLKEDDALSHMFYRVLDPTVCIYECEVRVFKECQNLPKQHLPPELTVHTAVPTRPVPTVKPEALWAQLHAANPPLVYDVREPREYQRAHIPEAQSLPLLQILSNAVELPRDRPVVLACRTGRRSLRAAAVLQQRGHNNVAILDGGMVAWEAAGLLEAVAVTPVWSDGRGGPSLGE
ncbi:MAG: sulfate permease [Anaerolineae bacterium]|nr:sulfate permease [Anaerolineae bacterium]